MGILGIGTNAVKSTQVAPHTTLSEEAVVEFDAEQELEATRAAAAEINVLEGVVESLQYGTWKTVALVRGLEDCKNRMVLQWQTTGVVSVLLASLLMPLVMQPPDELVVTYDPDATETDFLDRVRRAANILCFFSLILNLGCILLAYILVIEVDQVVDDVDFSEFVEKFQHWDEVLKTFFTFSCLFLVGTIMTGLYIRCYISHLMSDFWGCLTFVCVCVVIVAIGATFMDHFTKARLSVARQKTKADKIDLVAATAKSAVQKERERKAASDGASMHSGSMIKSAVEKPDARGFSMS